MNHLGGETSPYLLQHAANPVDWHPWGPEALALARATGRPILLSIGYSACHWCHVMAHESFEDPAVARVMNELFVNIKVDREERPDLDRIYQMAHQLIARRPGGWPLTMFLTPAELVPIFAGTYFPKEPRYGMPAFPDLLRRVAAWYGEHAAEVGAEAESFRAALARMEPPPGDAAAALTAEPLKRFRAIVAQQFDEEFGGFGEAPKFPHATGMELLLHLWWDSAADSEPDLHALYMTALTLRRMGEGGIHDQLGGGFCRYSTDRSWTIPHFEKMLYDNGPLLGLAAVLWRVSGDEVYRRIANDTADWALRDMRTPEGAFISSLDADSQGEEGRFYVWTPAEVRDLLEPLEYAVVAPHFGLDRQANFEQRHWHLRVCQPLGDVAASLGIPVSTAQRHLDAARARLLAVRAGRVWPGRDDKVLASWNGLMIRGLAVAARALDRPELAAAAAAALDFVRTRCVADGRLLAAWKGGRARFNAYLDDHAFLLDATLELLQARWNTAQLGFAVWLAEELLARFADSANGGFFFTANDHERLLHRSKPMSDEAMPSGNGTAALALGRLGHLLGETRYLDAAAGTLRAGSAGMQEYPHAHATLLMALAEHLAAPELLVIRAGAAELPDWLEVARTVYAPHRLVFGIPAGEPGLPPLLASRAADSPAVAYLCTGTACGPALRSLGELGAALARPTRSGPAGSKSGIIETS